MPSIITSTLPYIIESLRPDIVEQQNQIDNLLVKQLNKAGNTQASQFLKGRLQPLIKQSPNVGLVVTGGVALWVLIGDKGHLKSEDRTKLIAAVIAGAVSLVMNILIPAMRSARKIDFSDYNARVIDGNMLKGQLDLLDFCFTKTTQISELLQSPAHDNAIPVAQCSSLLGNIEEGVKAQKQFASPELLVAVGSVRKTITLIRSDGKVTDEELTALKDVIVKELEEAIENDIKKVKAQCGIWQARCAHDPSTSLMDVIKKPQTGGLPLISNVKLLNRKTEEAPMQILEEV